MIFLAITCLIVLFIITAYLVWMNWNEKIYSSLLSILFVGTITTFVTVFLMLQESTIEKDFSTIVIVNNQTGLPPFIVPQDSPNMQSERFNNYYGLAAPKEDINGKSIVYFEVPKNRNEARIFYEELVLYTIFKELVVMQKLKIGTTQSATGLSASVEKPFKLSESEKIKMNQLLGILDSFRFSRRQFEKFGWDSTYFNLPRQTDISFERTITSKENGSGKHKIIFEKHSFFKIEIIVETIFGPNGPIIAPSNLIIQPPEAIQNCMAYTLSISLRATFDKLTAGNKKTEEYKNWVNWMFNNLEQKFSDR